MGKGLRSVRYTMSTHQPLHCQVALTNEPELLMAQRLLQRSEPGALRNGEEERVERLPGIRMAGNAEDVLVRRDHLQNGETNTNGQRLHGRGYSIGCSYGYVMLQNGRTPYVQSIEKLSPRDHRP